MQDITNRGNDSIKSHASSPYHRRNLLGPMPVGLSLYDAATLSSNPYLLQHLNTNQEAQGHHNSYSGLRGIGSQFDHNVNTQPERCVASTGEVAICLCCACVQTPPHSGQDPLQSYAALASSPPGYPELESPYAGFVAPSDDRDWSVQTTRSGVGHDGSARGHPDRDRERGTQRRRRR